MFDLGRGSWMVALLVPMLGVPRAAWAGDPNCPTCVPVVSWDLDLSAGDTFVEVLTADVGVHAFVLHVVDDATLTVSGADGVACESVGALQSCVVDLSAAADLAIEVVAHAETETALVHLADLVE